MKLIVVAFAVKPFRDSPKLSLALASFSWEHRCPGLGSAQCGPGWLRQQWVYLGREGPDDCSAHSGRAWSIAVTALNQKPNPGSQGCSL